MHTLVNIDIKVLSFTRYLICYLQNLVLFRQLTARNIVKDSIIFLSLFHTIYYAHYPILH